MTTMTDNPAEIPAEAPAAFNGSVNGAPTPAKQTADGVAAIAGMLSQMPQAMTQALAVVLQQVPVLTRQHLCAQCVVARMGWNLAHERELRTALETAAQAHGIPDGDPRLAQLDPAPFLPEQLQVGGPQAIPPVHPSVTTVGGTEVCSEHIPNRPGGQKLLVASAAFSPSMLAGLG
jgi:hypothetical protein